MFQMEHLHLGEILGEGSFGRVYRGQRHGQAVAVKRTMLTHHAIQEVDILRSLEHTNIIPLQEAIIEGDYLFMVMPLCDEDLNAFLRREGPRNQPSRFFRVMRELAAAVTECHRRQIVHRDIKPANILRRRCRFLLADFGLAETLTTTRPLLTEPAGTMVYWAPEQRRLEPYDTSVDLWALGLVAVEVATGLPCRQGEEEQHWALSLDDKYRAEMERLRFPVRWYIEGLLQDNPSHRRPAAQWEWPGTDTVLLVETVAQPPPLIPVSTLRPAPLPPIAPLTPPPQLSPVPQEPPAPGKTLILPSRLASKIQAQPNPRLWSPSLRTEVIALIPTTVKGRRRLRLKLRFPSGTAHRLWVPVD
ncbi:cell division control protein 2 homolog 3-like [Coccinella septempunctata]|uniref:cell division control protein 2 homolog 3-like n=1 Tax=Coccinella septempunctata TaxID=41139 RepID=UPI001D0811B0|nr:cell division control protein 2 homolog 3-like [Coccinella septempunctata]